MAGLTQAQAADLAKLSSDLLFILQEAHVSLPNQAQIGHLDVVSVPLFAGLDETRVKVQEALAPPLDVEGNAANRLEMAKLLATQRNRAEARLGTQQRLVQPSEHQAMRAAVERVLGTLRDKEVPAKQVIAAKLEMLESNSPTAVLLTEVASVEDAEVESFEAKIDPVTNTLKIKSGKHSVAAPSTPEDLRLRHRRIGLAWDMLATKHSNRAWLSPNMNDCMRRFSDFILGTQVAGLVAGSRVPSWSLVLAFEHECRKAVCKWLRDGKVNTLADGYEKALSDVELLNRYFVIPFSLNTKETGWAASNNQDTSTAAKGKLTKATDGTPICWKFNRRGGCQDQNCRFLHIVSVAKGNILITAASMSSGRRAP
ncbi:unnamed protein product [Symbiodinium microadriaticum]|nr:unnamed protein product [Symbiodinium microadriaticum]